MPENQSPKSMSELTFAHIIITFHKSEVSYSSNNLKEARKNYKSPTITL